ncbi:hypothetical protein FT663_05209 [Candidozyma haemuli var. vulneris]|nr:hypothetical protein FT663_05209 [[Candida] haemuloni var. vulneris]KAF3987182.1 hypothetical protein FT662_04135 [[Candida] haemuloni var. vulneris]
MPQDDKSEDLEDSFITQFETTLSIRPSNDLFAEDITIDQSYFVNGSKSSPRTSSEALGSIKEQQKEPYAKQHNHKQSERTLNTDGSFVAPSDSVISKELLNSCPELESILEPSPLIDLQLLKFRRTFAEFISANPQIEQQSPRFVKSSDQTLVLLSPFSTEHSFGRSWVSKSYLSTIFERPQRLLASCIGVAAALSMYPFFYSIQNSDRRSSIFSKHVTKVHGKNWPKLLFNLCLGSHEKLSKGELEVPPDWNPGDIYLTPKSITALEGVIGTIETAVDALFGTGRDVEKHKLAFVVLRPPGHHSHACLPSGFCVLNNAQIGVEYAFQTYGVTHCAILDIDLHHGDGTQDICWERGGFYGDYGKDDEIDGESPPRNEHGKRKPSSPKVGYFSLHDIKSYPTELGFASKENLKNASVCMMDHDINIWNVHLQEWASEEEFYKHYQTKYVAILNRANQFLNQAKRQHEQEHSSYIAELTKYKKFLSKPHLYKQPVTKPSPPPAFKPLIIISAGLDASEYENPQMQRHGVNVPTSFYAKFTKDVVKLAQLHTYGKVISFLEGGYSDGALISGIFSHLIGLTNNQKENTDDPVLWNGSWGTEHVVKELTKGCKRQWVPYKNPKTEVTIWANEVIKLGRSLMPQSILPANHSYSQTIQASEDRQEPTSKMLRELYDNGGIPPIDIPAAYGRRALRKNRQHVKLDDS